jgi:tRNA (guanosine-2'-O-)-methyltransferase
MPTPARLKKLTRAVENRQKDFVLILEDIHDPHNAEAIFRSCDAFGIQDVYLIFEKQKKYNPRKVGKSSSSSANKWLDFHIFSSTKKCLTQLKKDGYIIYATVLHEDAVDINKTDFVKNKKVAVLIGNEHSGVSESAIELSDKKIIIPMLGMVQSFNVSVTAAMFLYEINRQRQESKKDFLLNKKSQTKLLKDFINR